MNWNKTVLTILLFALGQSLMAQDDDIFGISRKAKNPKSESGLGNTYRNILEQFAIEFSTGAAYHQMGMDFFSETPQNYPLTQVQNFDSPLDISEENPLALKANDWAFPLANAGVRLNLFNILTVGGRYGREWGQLSSMKGGDFEFPFEGASYQASKLYGTVGLVLWDAGRRAKYLKWRYRKYASANLYMQSELRQRVRQIYPWRFILEGEYGRLNLKKVYDPALDSPGNPYLSRLTDAGNPYYGLGLRLERDFSEYTKLFVKGGVDIRKFTYSSFDFTEVQDIEQRVYALQLGLAIKIPGTKRCKVAGCGVVMKHSHNGIEYRGSSIFRLQNRKIGQWY
ncbi:hypothetical protein [Algoriphagus sp. CAU 1675]|uniref:hypothetical protein n=1 Tax=Algoriphagus sp. CAU 1675 TaxID=3032597 RepID=UPI0023DA4095|nr:hypothetical protein [Algoriphagus sp. CAU 1675]MDF2157691.1 hypothetical protein [Algoriphagus sp. CAU 1675]